MMSFYVDFFSEIMKNENVKHDLWGEDEEQQIISKDIFLKDIYKDPHTFIKKNTNHCLHRIMLIDVNGLQDSYDSGVLSLLAHIHSSMQSLLKYTLLGKNIKTEDGSDYKQE